MGFNIQRGPSGGIFVSSVNDNSLAEQAGLALGDQLLEVSLYSKIAKPHWKHCTDYLNLIL